MNKPLATLGEALNQSADWRAQLRVAEIPRRAPPSDRGGRPDRGYVEQPEERVTPTPRRVVITMADLEREQLRELADEVGEPLEEQRTTRPPPERETQLMPQPETQPSAAAATPVARDSEMPKPAKAERVRHPEDLKAQAVAMIYERQAIEGKRKGIAAEVARELGLNDALMSYWLKAHVAKHGDRPLDSAKTLFSPPSVPNGAPSNGFSSGPVSGPVSISGTPPPVPTVSIPGLEEYIRALVVVEFKAQMKKAFGG